MTEGTSKKYCVGGGIRGRLKEQVKNIVLVAESVGDWRNK